MTIAQSSLHQEQRGFRAVVDVQLPKYMGHVGFHSWHADEKLLGDFFVFDTPCYVVKYLQFSF